MRLRTRLTLAFTALALLPVALVGQVTLTSVRAAFEDMLERRLDDAEAMLRAEIERRISELGHTVGAVAGTAPGVARLARELRLGRVDEAAAVPLAEGLMAGRDLEVLFLVDGGGRVLSAGHLPARFGDAAPELLELAHTSAGVPVLRWVDLRRGDRIEPGLAVLVGRPAEAGTGAGPAGEAALHVIGGRLVDARLAERLQALTGAEVRLRIDEAATEEPALSGRVRVLPLIGSGEAATGSLAFSVSDAPLARLQAGILLALGGSAAFAVLAAVLLGTFLASRITRPVDALAEGAGRVARGDYDTEVEARASGEVAMLVAAFNAMTREIRASRERIASAERVAAWQEIARRLAHEIKNPLTPIATSIETLRRTWKKQHPDFEEIFAESTGAILEEVEALQRLVGEFSRFARLPQAMPEPLSPAEVVDGALALFPEPPSGVRLERTVAADLPPVQADRDQLGQVLLNLLTNALQAVEAGGGAGTIAVRAGPGPEPETVSFEVADDGPGIPEAHMADLFTPYFTTKETGTGLGLAICHRIVVEHGGRIEVDSAPGRGARFSVVLPAAS
jgi:two-component system, NtrC family, nitrogen regulation sensor histidine kinase NtrY